MKRAASNSRVGPRWPNAIRKWAAVLPTVVEPVTSNKAGVNLVPKWPNAANAATAVETEGAIGEVTVVVIVGTAEDAIVVAEVIAGRAAVEFRGEWQSRLRCDRGQCRRKIRRWSIRFVW